MKNIIFGLSNVIISNYIFLLGKSKFAKSMFGGPVFRFSANFAKYSEWALERQGSNIAENYFGGLSSLEILYSLPNPLLVGHFLDFLQISLSALGGLRSGKGAKLSKQFFGGFAPANKKMPLTNKMTKMRYFF